MATPTYTLIQSTTLSSNDAYIEFTSIPQTYIDLKISLLAGQSSTTDGFWIRINNDTATNYTFSYLIGTGSGTEVKAEARNSTAFSYGDLGGTAIETFADMTFADYANATRRKSTMVQIASKQRGRINTTWGLWRVNDPITSIKLMFSNTNTFVSGTTANLYGIGVR